ncbi:MAG: aldo/keto reductase, partial [Phycisphaeraceae bacterium]
GTWRASDDEAADAVTAALDVGYRHIDTAAVYRNEAGVGRAIAAHDVPRDEVFVTTKVWNDAIRAGADEVQRAVDASLDRLGFEQVDLVLLHWAVGDYVDAWAGLEAAYDAGKARAIGVSNFMVEHLEHLLQRARVAPMVNQVEFHPYLVQPELLRFCREQGIQHEAWAPLMQGRVMDVAEVRRVAEAHGKTPAQVAIRWCLQRGSVTIPKSVHRARIEQNADVFDFELTTEQMQALDALDRNERVGPDPRDVTF